MRNDLKSRPTPIHKEAGKKRVLVLVLAGSALLLAGWLILRSFKSEEDRVREVIEAAAQGFRDRHPAHITDTLADDFKAFEHLGKEEIHGLLAGQLLFRYRKIAVSITPSTVPVTLDPNDPKKAVAEFRAMVTGQAEENAPWEELNRQAGGTHLKCGFRKTDQGWKFISVELQRD